MSQRRPTDLRLEELAERKAQMDALSARLRLKQKKDEDRIKLLLGNLSAEPAHQGPQLVKFVQRDLPDRLTQRDRDRGLWQKLFPKNEEASI